ncbi:MAG: hypothetical protein COB09_02605 [Thalassobium sp.]|nr:MAG: hypothetical protein COB09_02605 [Thalassobium sp.]
MEQAHNQIEAEASGKKKSAWWEKWLFVFLIVAFPSLMIYLNANGTDTGLAFQKLLGFILIGSVVIGVVALIGAVLIRIGALLFGKGK